MASDHVNSDRASAFSRRCWCPFVLLDWPLQDHVATASVPETKEYQINVPTGIPNTEGYKPKQSNIWAIALAAPRVVCLRKKESVAR